MGYTQLFEHKEILKSCKEKLPAEVGEIWWAPVSYIVHAPLIFKATRANPADHNNVEFEVREIAGPDFTSVDKLPVKRLNLGETEEAVISVAKKRPCLVLSRSGLSDAHLEAIADGTQKRLAKQLGAESYIVAPIFSCATYAENKTFGPIMTARIKSLIYPQFFYLPSFKPDDKTDPGGIIRLDRVFATYLGRGCQPQGLSLGKDVLELLAAQFGVLCGTGAAELWVSIRNDLWDAIAAVGHVPKREGAAKP